MSVCLLCGIARQADDVLLLKAAIFDIAKKMTYILDGLFVGDLDDALNEDKLKNKSITHILTLDMKPLPLENRDGFVYKYIHALDLDDFDLLANIKEAVMFIEEGRKDGGILVHCSSDERLKFTINMDYRESFAGQSRSVTAALAYIMSKLDLGLDDAFTLVKKQKSDISPNPGFLHQLELYEEMGNTVNQDSQKYKQYRLQNLAIQVQTAQIVGSLPAQSLSIDPSLGGIPQGVFYRCKKCRRPLFKKSALLLHKEGFGESAFGWQKSLGQREDAPDCHTSLFIEPVQWMERDIMQIEGKLACPKCSSKLGSFKWTGEKCPCGTWVTPAFHIQANKVDEAKQQQRPVHPINPPVIRPSQGFRNTIDITEESTYSNVHHDSSLHQNLGDVTSHKNNPQDEETKLCNETETNESEISDVHNNKSGAVDSAGFVERVRKRSEREESLNFVVGLGEAVAKCNLRQDEDLPPL